MNVINIQKISKKHTTDFQKSSRNKNDFRRQRRDAAKAKRKIIW